MRYHILNLLRFVFDRELRRRKRISAIHMQISQCDIKITRAQIEIHKIRTGVLPSVTASIDNRRADEFVISMLERKKLRLVAELRKLESQQ